MKKFTITLLTILAALFIYKACEEETPEPPVDETNKLVFESLVQDSVSYRTATFSYTIGNMEKNTVNELGICYATHEAPTIEDNTTAAGNTNATGTVTLQNLEPGTEYFACVYTKLGDAASYSDVVSFLTTATDLPVVTTNDVTNITATTAACGGEVTEENGSSITARGVCYSTSPNPTTADNPTSNGTGTGSFTSQLTGLSLGTTYYVRAYATNEAGTAYGVQKEFTTKDGEIEISTAEITNITATSATTGGNITDDGGFAITARGVCYSTSPNPTTADNPTSDGTGTGSFTSELTGLNLGTTYYVRAYATNEAGTDYGTQREFIAHDFNMDFNIDPNITQSSYAVGANNNYLVYNSSYSRLDFKAKRESSSSGYGGHPYWFVFNPQLNISQTAYSFNLEISHNNPGSFATACYFLITNYVIDEQNGGMQDSYNIGFFIGNDTRHGASLFLGLYKNDQNGYYASVTDDNIIAIETATEYNVRIEIIGNDLQLTLKGSDGITLGTILIPIEVDDFDFQPNYLLYVSGSGGYSTPPYFEGILNSIITELN